MYPIPIQSATYMYKARLIELPKVHACTYVCRAYVGEAPKTSIALARHRKEALILQRYYPASYSWGILLAV
jgi:hypothetical protein